jgi:hypothetical protein
MARRPTRTPPSTETPNLRYDAMSGLGYHLPTVPYVMYFHRGRGLHGN